MPSAHQLGSLLEPESQGESGGVSEVEQIVEQNVRTGRFERVRKARAITLEEYTSLVTISYAAHHHLVACLAEGEPEAWEHLWLRLFQRAYDLLLLRGWGSGEAYERAQEAAQNACLTIYCKVFPYDCSFDAWAFLILRHQVFRAYHRSRSPIDHPQMIDAPEALDDSDALRQDAFELIEEVEPLLAALRQLRSHAQRQAIEYIYLEGLSADETAQRMGKSVQAIYNLTDRALDRLRILLGSLELE